MCIFCDKKNDFKNDFKDEKKEIHERKFKPSLEGTTELFIRDCEFISEIPCINTLENLVCLNCHNLCSISIMPNLKNLVCTNTPKMRSIPICPKLKSVIYTNTDLSFIPCLSSLRIINVYNSPNLREIPFLENLKELVCRNCDIEDVGSDTFTEEYNSIKFPHLQTLDLTDNPIVRITNDFPKLTYLILNSCKRLIDIRIKAPILQVLELDNCTNLETIPFEGYCVSLEYFTSLSKLSINNCSKIKEMLLDTNKLEYLSFIQTKNISLPKKLPKLKKLFCDFSDVRLLPEMPNLVEISANFCPNLISLPSSNNLQRISCNNCNSLIYSPYFHNLKEFYHSNCPNLKTVQYKGN